MKIFVSYSRRDADFAQHIEEYFQGSGHDVFTDVKDIQLGVAWTSAIESNISSCDIFVVIITNAAIRSTEVEKEVLQAQKENKKIIPCIHIDVNYDEIKWNLKSIQGINFQDKYDLSRILYSKIVGKRPPSTPPLAPGLTRDDYVIKHQGLNLKIIIPIVAVIGIVGIILAFTIFSSGVVGFPINNNTTSSSPHLVDDPPVPLNDSPIRITMNQSVNIPLLATNKDHNDDLNTIIISNPSKGKLSNVDQATGIVKYTPNPGFTGTDEFIFKVNDKKKNDNNTGTVHITINQPLS